APTNVTGNARVTKRRATVGLPPNLWPSDPTKLVVKPSDGRYASSVTEDGSEGFYVLGPAFNFPTAADPRLPEPTFRSPGMTYRVAVAAPPTILLRRLACPHLPPDNRTTLSGGAPNPFYNPYITVDYMEDVPVNDGTAPVGQRASWGR